LFINTQKLNAIFAKYCKFAQESYRQPQNRTGIIKAKEHLFMQQKMTIQSWLQQRNLILQPSFTNELQATCRRI